MKEEDNNSFCGISMKPGKTCISKPEKQQSAWELFRELNNKYFPKFINKLCKKLNIELRSLVCMKLLDYSEQDATKIMLEIKQELEK